MKPFEYLISYPVKAEEESSDPRIGEVVNAKDADEEAGVVGTVTYLRTLEVFPANLYMSVKREKMLDDAHERFKEAKEKPDSIEQILEWYYAANSACSTGQVPTFYEFCYVLSDDTSEAWGEIVRQVNPHWFGTEKKMT